MRVIRSSVFRDSGQADDAPLVVHAVDDQAALRHRHRGDRVADIGRNAPLEVELGVLHVCPSNSQNASRVREPGISPI